MRQTIEYCPEQAVVDVALENDGNVNLIVNFGGVIQKKGGSIHSACTKLLHIPLEYSGTNAHRVL